ncbi:sporulation-specific protein 15 [uncultured Selenomonas sp.]|uniref:sporulation-specific protein 15 n=1 Tax=uncultured Selenomonas sp. TaxID=159275 RepID=UPI0025F775E3|nr:sporulation-specific protein 15 [uncultured Selenomonas sp.]
MENKIETMQALARLKRHIDELHTLRNRINTSLAKINETSLDQALTQKKHLKELKTLYAQLEKEITVLPPMDAAEIMEPEFDYITTIENILTTTAELKRGAAIGKENTDALRSGLIAFYDGLRKEMGR